MSTDFGYGDVEDVAKETSSGGKYLSLRQKGESVQVRLVSEPKYIFQYWAKMPDGSSKLVDYDSVSEEEAKKKGYKKSSKWGWIVLDRGDGNKVKIFTGPITIAQNIQAIARKVNKATGKPAWGDPRTYDIVIERTEQPGASYYTVDPIAEGKGEPLTEEETKAIEEANFDLAKELKGGRESKHVGNYKDEVMENIETVPEDEEDTGKEETSGGDESDEDDIPF